MKKIVITKQEVWQATRPSIQADRDGQLNY